MKIFILRDDEHSERVKCGLYNELKSLDLTKPMQVEITEYKQNKTSEQRSGWHTLCGIFGNEVGHTKLQIKRLMLKEVFGSEMVLGVEIEKSSESLKREEYSQLIEQTYITASSMGIILPLLGR